MQVRSSAIASQPGETYLEILFSINSPTHIWYLEYEEESNGEHIEPESEPGAWKSKSDPSYVLGKLVNGKNEDRLSFGVPRCQGTHL